MDRQANVPGLSRAITEELKGKRFSTPFIEQHIEENPDHPGKADARLREYGHAVWLLAGYAMNPESSIQELVSDYQLPIDKVYAALGYYRRNRRAINTRLAANIRRFL